MNRRRYRWPVRFAILFIAGIALLVWALAGQSEQRLVVENQSGQPIATLEITVAGHKGTFKNLPASGKATAPFSVEGGEAFAVQGKLRDGTLIRGSGKTVERAPLVILPGGQINFRQPGRASP
jgi:hypothetical protein